MMIFPSLLELEEQTDPMKTGVWNTIVNRQQKEDQAAPATADNLLRRGNS